MNVDPLPSSIPFLDAASWKEANTSSVKYYSRAGAPERILKFGGVLRDLLVLYHEHMVKAVADETSERSERRKRPDDLKRNDRVARIAGYV